ncbi:hypothetical protein BAZ12_11505 [Elizabethkingia miricola]|jgi:FMN-dependent NADH-azoreductase|uniref:FMN dependent NADH:quinone oxidoreductase n=1 Tax=Elizabethkingia miricola TaxID=172045 RepID=A0ABD4DNT4_ELIMR|nr:MULTISPECIES: NAD(P)H-dependent oxidoreductase [Elizabethkingia]KUY20579.1 hypothetical protein ATB95_06640 [Elizabethkingia miricola]MCL1653234.1 NAD(P)H-dependent oxidoreductase [Elizabethkingia miricola]OPC70402.1 hypothetical protein BAZ12_11505 [Elizabethkingia miricola]OPC74331.1 hypothetical protein BAZ13_04775 [Elizabethkingia miricola]QCO45181.1 FMN-dependent NADH-azoreductase [Elizabethkingia sp. 2-6]
MKNILHTISSARGTKSHSYGLSTAILEKLIIANPTATIKERNLTQEFPPYIDEALAPELYKTPADYDETSHKLLEYSDTIFNEVKNADIIVIGTPMHNFSISAPLKAWIDLLVRVGISYGFDNTGARVGYLKGKKVYLAIASGGKSSTTAEGNDYLESYIRAVFDAYTGITDICTFRVEGTIQNDYNKDDYKKIIKNLK